MRVLIFCWCNYVWRKNKLYENLTIKYERIRRERRENRSYLGLVDKLGMDSILSLLFFPLSSIGILDPTVFLQNFLERKKWSKRKNLSWRNQWYVDILRTSLLFDFSCVEYTWNHVDQGMFIFVCWSCWNRMDGYMKCSEIVWWFDMILNARVKYVWNYVDLGITGW